MSEFIIKDDWLTEQIKKSVYELKLNKLNNIQFCREWENFLYKQNNPLLVYAKINTTDICSWLQLEKANFNLIDTNVKFELDNKTKHKFNFNEIEDINICFSNSKNQKIIGNIAKNNFIYSRFHLDPEIPSKTANQIKKNWVKNYFLGSRGDKMILCLIKNNPVAFLQLIIKESVVFIDLIGVDKKVQGKNIASAMIKFAIKNIKCKYIKVGTQIGNLPSIRLYQKMGFIFSGSDYVFHYHK